MKFHYYSLTSFECIVLKFQSLWHLRGLFSFRGLRNLPFMLALMMLASCQSAKIQKTTAFDKTHWVKAFDHPPSYVARGYDPADGTTYSEGEWIESGDAKGSRYFIPYKVTGPVPRPELVKEAIAARTDKKRQEIASHNRKHLAKNLGLFVLGTPVWMAYGIAQSGMGGYTGGGSYGGNSCKR